MRILISKDELGEKAKIINLMPRIRKREMENENKDYEPPKELKENPPKENNILYLKFPKDRYRPKTLCNEDEGVLFEIPGPI